MITTACPLDCYDGCGVVFDGNFKASKNHILSNKKLCTNFGKLLNQKPLTSNLPLCETLEIVKTKLLSASPQKILYYKGSGNLGVMNDITKLVFSKMGATITTGSLCDGSGEAGIVANRGAVINPEFSNLTNSDIIIVWGRNLTVTSPHIYNAIKDKEFITIDPIKTEIAKKSILHIQIKPKTDYLLALVLARFIFIEDSENKQFLDSIQAKHKEFYEFTRGIRIKEAINTLGISLNQIGDLLHLIAGKKVAFLIGLGVQKYFEGDDIIRCIDALGAVLGLFNQQSGGVWYLSDSKYGFVNPFEHKPTKTTAKPSVDFGEFDVVFIQGANPAVSSPNTKKVIDGLKKSFVIYFGTTINETCQYADLIIPAKSFRAKNDIRLSYATDEIIKMNKITDEENCISEYELAKFLDDDIKDEEYYLQHFTKREQTKEISYFNFIDEIDVELESLDENEFYLVTCKSKNSLNSQFANENFAYFSKNSAIKEGCEITLKSKSGTANFVATMSEDVRDDTVMIYAGTKNVNFLTTNMSSKNGSNAIFQEQKVRLLEL